MPNYCVNDDAQSTGEHEVHDTTCSHAPASWNRTELGSFSNCRDAVGAAKKVYAKVDGCYWCSRECHTR